MRVVKRYSIGFRIGQASSLAALYLTVHISTFPICSIPHQVSVSLLAVFLAPLHTLDKAVSVSLPHCVIA